MGYIMQRGAAPKFKELGSSPLEYEKDPKEFEKRKSKEDLQTKVNIGPEVDPNAPPVITNIEDPKQREELYSITEKEKR
jgi:hypothetical protein